MNSKTNTKINTTINTKTKTKMNTKTNTKLNTKMNTKINTKLDTNTNTKTNTKTKMNTKMHAKMNTSGDFLNWFRKSLTMDTCNRQRRQLQSTLAIDTYNRRTPPFVRALCWDIFFVYGIFYSDTYRGTNQITNLYRCAFPIIWVRGEGFGYF